MSYGFNDDQLDLGTNFPLSDNIENVYLENAEYNFVKDQYEVIDFNWARPNGQRQRQRIFAVDESTTTAFSGMSLEDTIKQKYNQVNTQLFRIAQAFGITKQELQNTVAGAKGFKSYASAVAKLINERSAGKEVRIKTILDKNGYVVFPRLGKFIQSMDEENTLAWSNWEKKNNEKHKNNRPSKKAEEVTDDTFEEEEITEEEVQEEDWL